MARVFKDIAFLEKAACDRDHRQKQSQGPAVLRYEPPFTCRAFEHLNHASENPAAKPYFAADSPVARLGADEPEFR